MTDNVNINSTRQLFLDDHVVDSMEGVQRRYHRPVRPIDRPVVDADLPWEQGPGPFLFGGTVIFDEEDRIFKMWYRTSERLERAPGGWQEVVSEDGTMIPYLVVRKEGTFAASTFLFGYGGFEISLTPFCLSGPEGVPPTLLR